MKFHHPFRLTQAKDATRIYESDSLTARLDFISGSAVRVAVYKSEDSLLATYNVCPDGTMPVQGRERLSLDGFEMTAPTVCRDGGADAFVLANGVKITLEPVNFLLDYFYNGSRIFGDRKPLSYNLDGELGSGALHYLSRAEDEEIFGLGDKGGTLNKANRTFKIETTDTMGYNAKTADPLYKHVPFYICKNAVMSYGIFYDTAATSRFDFGVEHNNYYEPYKFFQSEDNCLVYYVFFGTVREVAQQFWRLCGRQAFPPKWSFDYCASTMNYTDAEDAETQMNSFLEKVDRLGLNCQGFYLSSGYTSIGDKRFVFHWNRDKFPQPDAFVRHFAENGIHIIPNIKPAFLENHPMYEMLKEQGLFIKNADGTPFVTQFWDGLGSYLDFTNPAAFAFWKQQVKEQLLDNGIDCTWNDNNEFDIRDNGAVAHGFAAPIAASKIRPNLTYLMDMASYEAQLAARPELRPFLSTRSGNIGVRRLAQTWSGDNRTAFEELRYCHNIGLTMSLSGYHFYGHDLGGFSGDLPSRELLIRWLQHGLFEPRFTIHSWNTDGSSTMPWSYPELLDEVRAIFAQRRRLIPYLYHCAYRAVYAEEPMNAPLFLYYDDMPTECDAILLGRDVLAAFVFDEGVEATKLTLPGADDWYLGEMLYSGGSTVTVSLPAHGEMPYFVRAGSVIATDEGTPGFRQEEALTLTVYPVKEGDFTATFFADDGESFAYEKGDCTLLELAVHCTAEAVAVTVKNNGRRPFDGAIRLHTADKREFILHEEC